jgi:DNA/RNA endonuclease G (NUC1)
VEKVMTTVGELLSFLPAGVSKIGGLDSPSRSLRIDQQSGYGESQRMPRLTKNTENGFGQRIRVWHGIRIESPGRLLEALYTIYTIVGHSLKREPRGQSNWEFEKVMESHTCRNKPVAFNLYIVSA